MLVKAIPKFFFYHHFFMAVCTVMLCLQTYWMLDAPVSNSTSFLAFLFTATLFSYNIHFFLAAKKNTGSNQLQWFKEYEVFTIILNLVSVITAFLLFLELRAITYYVLIAAALNAAYTAPLLFKSSLKLPLPFTFVKSYFIGFTWAFATVLLPLVYLQKEASPGELCIFIHRFLLVSSATLLFDYRDKQSDQKMGVHTPANTMTEKQYRYFFLINLFIMSCSVFSIILLYHSVFQVLQFLPCLYLWWLYTQSKKRTDDIFFLSYVDGALFLSALLSIFLLI